jgi:hypothetical protein
MPGTIYLIYSFNPLAPETDGTTNLGYVTTMADASAIVDRMNAGMEKMGVKDVKVAFDEVEPLPTPKDG